MERTAGRCIPRKTSRCCPGSVFLVIGTGTSRRVALLVGAIEYGLREVLHDVGQVVGLIVVVAFIAWLFPWLGGDQERVAAKRWAKEERDRRLVERYRNRGQY